METVQRNKITVEATIDCPVEKVCEYWTSPKHITQWCAASDDWHAPHAENDLLVDGKFKTTMAAKDGSVSFDFEGAYTAVKPYEHIEYAMTDGRKVQVQFVRQGARTKVIETFEAENENSPDVQRSGWQAILDNFKAYAQRSVNSRQ